MAPRGSVPGPSAFDDDGGESAPAGPTVVDWGRLVADAAWRRRPLAVVVFLGGLLAAVVYFALKTPVYRVEAKILAQRPQALPSAARSVFEDAPTRSAWELIHRRDNLIAIVHDTKLIGPGRQPPAPGTDTLERLAALWTRRASAADPLDTLVNVLDRRLIVEVEDGTILISLDWGDPQQAFDIVNVALQNFLEARHLQEVTAIDEVISVLQGRAAALREELETATQDARQRAARTPRVAMPRVRQPSGDLVRLQTLLEAKQRAIQDVEEFRRRRLADLQAQLDQTRNTLSDLHPMVIGLRKDIDALSRDSSQIEGLREEERKVRRDYAERLAKEGFPSSSTPSATPLQLIESGPDPDQDQRVRQAWMQYEQMLGRVNTARTELDAARAAFKYRYSVIWPPQIPREPLSPRASKILGLGALASVLLALAAAAAPDVLRGRIVQRWQVERSLGVEVLGELDRRA